MTRPDQQHSNQPLSSQQRARRPGARRVRVPPDQPVFVISVAADLVGVHPQTLRSYERAGLVTPSRTSGGSRRYSPNDIDKLRRVQALTDEGISLAGAARILELERRLAQATGPSTELVPRQPSPQRPGYAPNRRPQHNGLFVHRTPTTPTRRQENAS